MSISRRHFLLGSGVVAFGFLGLRTLYNEQFTAYNDQLATYGYGPLLPDPDGVLDLPAGFSYQIISKVGERMDDGFFVPGKHDGMAAFPGPNGTVILVRNHELEPGDSDPGPFGRDNELLDQVDREMLYDAGKGVTPGPGGTTTLVYDTKRGILERHYLSLAGTHRNCSGGPTPWGSWLSCEETTQRAKDTIEKDHGYNFEVPASASIGLVKPVPLRAMGRFNHEAVALDPKTGIVYQTEDDYYGLIYRFIPDVPGRLFAGGRLQALKISDMSRANTHNHDRAIPVGQPMAVEWIDIEDVESPEDDLREQGFAKGAAQFTRGEGMWYSRGEVYFACSGGGKNDGGQIWRYIPSPKEGQADEQKQPGWLELFIQPDNGKLIKNADNLTVAPWGDLILCEDRSDKDDDPVINFLVGVTPKGKLFKCGKNVKSDSEFAGATFSPDGSTLFVNIQDPGLTLAITGPWMTRI